jgi:hypothetical protein
VHLVGFIRIFHDPWSRELQMHSNTSALSPNYVCLQPNVPVANWLTKTNLSQWSLFRVWTWNASNSIRTLSRLLLRLIWLLSCNMVPPQLLIIFIVFRPSSYSAWGGPRSSQPNPRLQTLASLSRRIMVSFYLELNGFAFCNNILKHLKDSSSCIYHFRKHVFKNPCNFHTICIYVSYIRTN